MILRWGGPGRLGKWASGGSCLARGGVATCLALFGSPRACLRTPVRAGAERRVQISAFAFPRAPLCRRRVRVDDSPFWRRSLTRSLPSPASRAEMPPAAPAGAACLAQARPVPASRGLEVVATCQSWTLHPQEAQLDGRMPPGPSDPRVAGEVEPPLAKKPRTGVRGSGCGAHRAG